MTRIIKLRRGLDINLAGKASLCKVAVAPSKVYALQPDCFEGVKPKVVVKEGDVVKAGDALFINKDYPEVKFGSPVSGKVCLVERGDRRKLLSIRVEADEQQEYREFGKKNVGAMDADAVKEALLEAGLFGFINQLPYAVSTNPQSAPKAIFVSALRDMPLAGDFEYELKGNEDAFQAGLTALSKIAKTYLGIGSKQQSSALRNAKDVEVVEFQGKCPAGNVGVQVNNIDPVNKGEVVWTVEPTAVIFFGRLFTKGIVDMTRTVAIAGEVKNPAYVDMKVGAAVAAVLSNRVAEDTDKAEGAGKAEGTGKCLRIIMGNPLTGKQTTMDGFLGAHTSEITVIPEGSDNDEMLGWIMPRFNQFSVNRSYFSWLFGKKKEYTIDARIKGGERHCIMSGEYDKVLSMDIYGEYLIKAIIAGDIDKQEQLGIYEVSPEDFALAEFVDSSKMELQKIVRQGLDILRKENA